MNEFWFKPRSFGFGATPVTWEGWAVVAIYLAAVAGIVLMVKLRGGVSGDLTLALGCLAIATVAMILLSWVKTDGAWVWSWG